MTIITSKLHNLGGSRCPGHPGTAYPLNTVPCVWAQLLVSVIGFPSSPSSLERICYNCLVLSVGHIFDFLHLVFQTAARTFCLMGRGG